MMMNRSEEKALWGPDEDSISPVGKWFRKNFTYDLERRNYYDRPYPITGTAFEDVPVVGSLLASTIGKIIKPPKLMHTPDWIRETETGVEILHPPEWNSPSYALGGLTPGLPQSPYGGEKALQQLSYQFRELEGMTGWAKNALTKLSLIHI